MKFKSSKGFTLIELLVVIAIISLLSSVVLAALRDARYKAQDSKLMQEIQAFQVAMELYKSEKGHYPGQGGELENDSECNSGETYCHHWLDIGYGADPIEDPLPGLQRELSPYLPSLSFLSTVYGDTQYVWKFYDPDTGETDGFIDYELNNSNYCSGNTYGYLLIILPNDTNNRPITLPFPIFYSGGPYPNTRYCIGM